MEADGASKKMESKGAFLCIALLKLSDFFITKIMRVILLNLEYTGKPIDNGKKCICNLTTLK